MKTIEEAAWASYHLFYHGDRERALLEFVRPAVASLWLEDRIYSFFFIRYSLGGPHIRLRLRPRPRCEAEVEKTLVEAAAEFLHRVPSSRSLSQEEILGQNRSLLAGDPNERDNTIYPDNTFLRFPLQFETDRYGGPDLLPRSLDLFAISSAEALRFIIQHRNEQPARRMAATFRLLLRQAWGLAQDEEELLRLLGYGIQMWGTPLQSIVSYSDRVFEQQRQIFLRLFEEEIAKLLTPAQAPLSSSPAGYTEACCRLAREIAGTAPGVRHRIGMGHMHMTANRLGLKNADEVYLSRLLVRTAELRGPLLHSGIAVGASAPSGRLRDLLPPALTELFAGIPACERPYLHQQGAQTCSILS